MAKAPLRTEIEQALDELVAYEEGMRFQSLAVVLAKLRWPELVACERKKDLGLDAVVLREQATDHVGRGLACSITPTYSKLAGDATKVAEHFGGNIQHLIFATSAKVGTSAKLEWSEQLRREYGFELEVMSREEIISALTDPRNLGLCRTYLRLDIEVDPTLQDTIDAIRDAAREEVTNWARRVADQPLMDLYAVRLASSGDEDGETWHLADMAAALSAGRRLILEGPAGRGKTTTLIQLAQGALNSEGTVLLIDLPQWANAKMAILPFITGMTAFQRRNITQQQLAKAESVERFYFLLNGWNEVSGNVLADADLLLRDLDRQHPAAGVLIATRTHHVPPPLRGAPRLRLRQIGRRARSRYVQQRLGERAPALLTALETDHALDDLTGTPFVLSEVVSIVAAGGPIPRSRVSVLDASVRLQEGSPEHAGALRILPIGGMSSLFMEGLAVHMMSNGAISLTESEARAVVHRVSSALAADGQLVPVSPPADILSALCGHHVLERFEYPEPAYRFAHQLFEEYYAYRALTRRLHEAMGDDRKQTATFVQTYLNDPAWTEPLLMLAESLNGYSAESGPFTNAFVGMAASVDLVFAAHLARVGALRADAPAARVVTEGLRAWYASTNEHHRRCALAGMLASGMDAFRDVVEPLLSGADNQERLRTYRLWQGFSPSVLGTDWKTVVQAWSEEARETFVSELLHARFAPEVSAFGLGDPSPTVREATIDALRWLGAEEEFGRALVDLTDSALARVAMRAPDELIPSAMYPNVARVFRARVLEDSDLLARIRVLRRLQGLQDTNAITDLKAALEQLPERVEADAIHYTVRPALDVLRGDDPSWTSEWVARRIADGRLAGDWWNQYLAAIPERMRDGQLAHLGSENLDHRSDGPVSIVARSATPDTARQAFLRLIEVQRIIAAEPDRPSEVDVQIYRQLVALLRAIAPSTVVSGLKELLSGPPERDLTHALIHLYGRTALADSDSIELEDPFRVVVRDYLRRAVAQTLAEDDTAGSVKAKFGSLLSQLGEPRDLDDLMLLIRADLRRVRDGRAALVRGQRTSATDGATISWTHSYVRSVANLLHEKADDVLLGLFAEPEYESSLLDEYARQLGRPPRRGIGQQAEYDEVWRNRARHTPRFLGERRTRVAEAIRKRIRQLEETRPAEKNPKHLNNHLKGLGRGLAFVAPHETVDEVLALLALPAQFDAHVCVDTLEQLLFAGVRLPAEKCLHLLDSTLSFMKQWGSQYHERWVVVRFLCVCPFVDPPAVGLDRIREVIYQAHLSIYDLRPVLLALGKSRFDGSLAFLLELVPSAQNWQAIEHEWLSALVALDTDSARRALLGLVDPDLPGLPFTLDWFSVDRVTPRIAEIANAVPDVESRLRELSLASLDDSRRQVLAKVLRLQHTVEALVSALNLIDDNRRPMVPSGVTESLEEALIQDQAHPIFAGAIVRRPAASNPVREALYGMVFNDPERRRSAYALLGQIEEWRLEYGRPLGEPRHPGIALGLPWPPPEPDIVLAPA